MTTKKLDKKGYYCCICDDLITKYQLDLKCCEIKVNGKYKLICDDCAKEIAIQIVGNY